MKTRFLLVLLFLGTLATAQSNALWVRDFVANSQHIFTYIDMETDADGNTYLLWIDHDFGHEEYLAKVDAAGNVAWLDTLRIPNRQFALGWSKCNLHLVGDRIVVGAMVYPTSGYEEAAVLVYDTNGNQLHHHEVPVWYQVEPWKVFQNAQHDVWQIYSWGTPFTTSSTIYVTRMDSALHVQWTDSFSLPKLCWDVTAVLDANDNLYFSYASDSIVGAAHHTQSYTRKLSPTGQELWLRPHLFANYKTSLLAGNYLVMAGKEYNLTNYASNDSGNALITFIDRNTGIESVNDNYNAASPWREITADLQLDANGNIWWLGVENVSSVGSVSATVIRKYNPSGALQWSVGAPNYTPNSNPGSLELDIYGNMWASNMMGSGNGTSVTERHWRLDATGHIDSTRSHSISPLYLGIIHSEADAHGNHYTAYQQAQCGNNVVGIIKYGTPIDPQGVGETMTPKSFSCIPNPANGATTIRLDAGLGGLLQVEVMDVSGRRMFARSENVGAGQVQVPVSVEGVEQGIYFLRVSLEGRNLGTEKLVVLQP